MTVVIRVRRSRGHEDGGTSAVGASPTGTSVTSSKPSRIRPFEVAQGQAFATRHVGPELAPAEVDPELRRRPLEDHPVDDALDDVRR